MGEATRFSDVVFCINCVGKLNENTVKMIQNISQHSHILVKNNNKVYEYGFENETISNELINNIIKAAGFVMYIPNVCSFDAEGLEKLTDKVHSVPQIAAAAVYSDVIMSYKDFEHFKPIPSFDIATIQNEVPPYLMIGIEAIKKIQTFPLEVTRELLVQLVGVGPILHISEPLVTISI